MEARRFVQKRSTRGEGGAVAALSAQEESIARLERFLNDEISGLPECSLRAVYRRVLRETAQLSELH